MCGIGGKLNFDRDEPASPALLRRMMQLMVHRGPDGGGEFVAGPVALGHRRLSIIDLDTGAQPMANEDGSVQLVFNGEIYNYAELRRQLIARGHRFRSTGDTEVIVHLYEEMGERCVTQLQGMFAFALWDRHRHRLLLARDRVGIKPLYVANTGRALVFASELKSLLADASVDRRLNVPAIDRLLTYHYLPGEETPIAGIRKLRPGHVLTVEADGRIRQERYWDLAFSQPQRPASLDASAQALHGLLDRTVRSHLVSDVPVGVLLSGGVDSTGVLHFATRHSSRPLHTFTMGFDDDDGDGGSAVADERPFARLAARACGTLHHETSMTAADFRELLPTYVWHMEEPVCEPPAVALYVVARLARAAGVKVLLSGEGGDEAFAGYSDYRNLLALEALKSAFGPARPVLGLGLRALGFAGWRRAGHYRSLLAPALADYYWSRTATPNAGFNRLKQALYRSSFAAQVGSRPSDAPTRLLHAAVQDQPLLNRMLYVDTHSWLPDDLLVKADKMSMAASVELRVPLLDHAVLEFAASLPHRHKLRGWAMKRVLRHALRGAIPQPVLSRKKAGFPVPYDRWMRHELKDFVADTILQRASFCDSCFERAELERLLAEHRRSGHGGKQVFSLLVLELWHRQFLGADAAASFEASGAETASPWQAIRPLAEAAV